MIFGAAAVSTRRSRCIAKHERDVFGCTRNTIVGRLLNTARRYPAYIRQRTTIALKLVRSLQFVQDDSKSVELEDSVGRWRQVAEFYAVRSHIVSQPSVYSRPRQLTLAYHRHQYCPGWGRGGQPMTVQDMIATVIIR